MLKRQTLSQASHPLPSPWHLFRGSKVEGTQLELPVLSLPLVEVSLGTKGRAALQELAGWCRVLQHLYPLEFLSYFQEFWCSQAYGCDVWTCSLQPWVVAAPAFLCGWCFVCVARCHIATEQVTCFRPSWLAWLADVITCWAQGVFAFLLLPFCLFMWITVTMNQPC